MRLSLSRFVAVVVLGACTGCVSTTTTVAPAPQRLVDRRTIPVRGAEPTNTARIIVDGSVTRIQLAKTVPCSVTDHYEQAQHETQVKTPNIWVLLLGGAWFLAGAADGKKGIPSMVGGATVIAVTFAMGGKSEQELPPRVTTEHADEARCVVTRLANQPVMVSSPTGWVEATSNARGDILLPHPPGQRAWTVMIDGRPAEVLLPPPPPPPRPAPRREP